MNSNLGKYDSEEYALSNNEVITGKFDNRVEIK